MTKPVVHAPIATGSTTARDIRDRFADVNNVKDFGAKGNGVTDDTLAIQNAIATGKDVYFPKGIYVVKDELTIVTHGQKLFGDGRGFGRPYGTTVIPVLDWKHQTTLLFKDPTNAGVRYVKTRYKYDYSNSPATPLDPAMSTGINIQAEGVCISDLCVMCYLADTTENRETTTIDDTTRGADWDIGIFVGSRLEVTLRRVASIGYFRKANIWIDVTHGPGYSRFANHHGVAFPDAPGRSGGDGTLFEDVTTHGGVWGVRIQGGEPKGPAYLDNNSRPNIEVDNSSKADKRGDYGFSDFTMLHCEIFGGAHHCGKRFEDWPSGVSSSTAKTRVATDVSYLELGGAFMISGISSNGSNVLRGHNYIGCRFASRAAFTVLVNYSCRDRFIGCHGEDLSFINSSGVETSPSTSNSFGILCLTSNHIAYKNFGSQLPYYSDYYDYKYGDNAVAAEYTGSYSHDVNLSGTHMLVSLENPSGTAKMFHMDYLGADVLGWYPYNSSQGLRFAFHDYIFYNELNGTDIFRLFNSGVLKLHNTLYSDNEDATLGTENKYWADAYIMSGSHIGGSDARLKDNIEEPDEALMRAWGKVHFRVFQMRDAIEKKGAEEARLHVGVIAQEVQEAFASEGLDASRYGLFCHDTWEAKPAVIDPETGEVEEPAQEAGDRYGIRYGEALALECAYQRWRLDRIEAALPAG